MNIKRNIKIALFGALMLGVSACSPSPESITDEHASILEKAAAALKSCTEYDDVEDTVDVLEKLTEKVKELRCKGKANTYKLSYKANSSMTEDDEDEINEKLRIARLKFEDGVTRVENYNSGSLRKAIEDFQAAMN